MGYEIKFLPADKHNSFLQIDIITLSVHDQACPKHPKQQLYNIFAISQGKSKRWSLFFLSYNRQTFLKSDTLVCVATLMKIFTNINRCLTDPDNRCFTDINRYCSHTLHIQS